MAYLVNFFFFLGLRCSDASAYHILIFNSFIFIYFCSDSDLHMTALALELCCTLMADRKSNQNVGLTVRQKVLPQALILVRSSLLQGQALQVLHLTFYWLCIFPPLWQHSVDHFPTILQALQSFFAALVLSANTSFDALLEPLLSTAKPYPQSLAKQALHSVAQCVAVLCLAAGDKKCASTVEMLTNILKADSSTNSVRFSCTVFFPIILQSVNQRLIL